MITGKITLNELGFTMDSLFLISQVKLLCTTRWVERHTTITELRQLYPYILKALEVMCGSGFDGKTATEASGLLTVLTSHGFIAAFTISERMLGYTKILSQQLQGERCSSSLVKL